jgi:hypothetical protein
MVNQKIEKNSLWKFFNVRGIFQNGEQTAGQETVGSSWVTVQGNLSHRIVNPKHKEINIH